MKLRQTVKTTATIKKGEEIIGVLWETAGTIAINPIHVVSQKPFTWSDDKGNSVSGIEVRTVLNETFYTLSNAFI